MSYLIRRVLAKPRLILDEMSRLYGKFASYLRHVLRVLFFVNVQQKRCGFSKTRLRHPSLPFDSLPYPTRTICRRVRSVNHGTTKPKEVDHILRSACGSPVIIST